MTLFKNIVQIYYKDSFTVWPINKIEYFKWMKIKLRPNVLFKHLIEHLIND